MALSGPKSRSDENDEESSIVAEINITPLTDIFLVLLVIFMVTTTVANQLGVSVNLPAASQKTTEAQPEGVIVTLLPNGVVQVNGKAVQLGDALKKTLSQAFQQTKSRLVILEGDRQAFLGSAIEVMDQCRQAGAQSFAIATQPN